MKKKLLWQLILVICISIVAMFSLATTAEVATGGYEGQIRMWTFLNPEGTAGREVALKQIITSFEKDFPNCKVIVEPQQWDVMTAKFFAAHQAGNAPDIMWVGINLVGQAMQMGALEPFENLFLKDWSDTDLADIEDPLWELTSKNGKHYTISVSRGAYGIGYREDLLKEKGITTPILTWDELIEAGKKLTEKDAKTGIQRYGFGVALSTEKALDPNVYIVDLLYRQGDLFTKDGKAMWSTESGIKAMQLQSDMIKVHNITPASVVNSNVDDILRDFAAGKYAMILMTLVRATALQEAATFDKNLIKFMLIPSFDGKAPSPSRVGAWCIGVWSKSQNKEAAGKFLEYMFNKESDKLWVTLGGQIPLRKSTIETCKDFLADPLNYHLSIGAKGIATASYFEPTNFKTGGYVIDINKAVQEIIINNKPIQEALADAEKAFNERNFGK